MMRFISGYRASFRRPDPADPHPHQRLPARCLLALAPALPRLRLGSSLCGAGCYVRHNFYVTRGETWGTFVEARTDAADAYRRQYEREKKWARQSRGAFGIFLSSSTEPFQPMERTHGVTRSVLEAMLDLPPDFLILQTHSHHVADYVDLYPRLARHRLACASEHRIRSRPTARSAALGEPGCQTHRRGGDTQRGGDSRGDHGGPAAADRAARCVFPPACRGRRRRRDRPLHWRRWITKRRPYLADRPAGGDGTDSSEFHQSFVSGTDGRNRS